MIGNSKHILFLYLDLLIKLHQQAYHFTDLYFATSKIYVLLLFYIR